MVQVRMKEMIATKKNQENALISEFYTFLKSNKLNLLRVRILSLKYVFI